jgi:hypothetical protein
MTNATPEIPFTKRVLEKGKLPKWEEADLVPEPVGYGELLGATIANNNLFVKLWEFARLQSARLEAAPVGWSPDQEIVGIFEPYKEFLKEARNPTDMLYRKQLVLKRINYNNLLARAGALKQLSAPLLAQFADPFTYVFGGLWGMTAGKVLGKSLAHSGFSRLGTHVVSGVLASEAFGAADYGITKALGSSPENPEFHVVQAALFGAAFGSVFGVLSEGAALGKFRLEFGRHEKDIRIYRLKDLRERQGLESVGPKEQLEFRALLKRDVDQFLMGELDATKYRYLSLDSMQGAMEKKVSRAMGWADNVVDLTSVGIRRLQGIFSNQGTLLTSSSDAVQAFGLKIFPTSYDSERLKPLVGDSVPLQTTVERWVTMSLGNFTGALKSGWEKYRAEGGKGSQKDFGIEVVRAIKFAQSREHPSAAVRETAKAWRTVTRDAALELHKREGFESQQQMREAYEAKRSSIQSLIKEEEEKLQNRLTAQEKGIEYYQEKLSHLQETLPDPGIEAHVDEIELNKSIQFYDELFEKLRDDVTPETMKRLKENFDAYKEGLKKPKELRKEQRTLEMAYNRLARQLSNFFGAEQRWLMRQLDEMGILSLNRKQFTEVLIQMQTAKTKSVYLDRLKSAGFTTKQLEKIQEFKRFITDPERATLFWNRRGWSLERQLSLMKELHKANTDVIRFHRRLPYRMKEVYHKANVKWRKFLRTLKKEVADYKKAREKLRNTKAKRVDLAADKVEESKQLIKNRQDELDKADADFERARGRFTLRAAEKELGGEYFPQAYNAELVANDSGEAERLFSQNYQQEYPRQVISRFRKIRDEIINTIPQKSLKFFSKEPAKRNEMIWKRFLQECDNRYINIGEIFDNPLTEKMTLEQCFKTLHRGQFKLSKEFLDGVPEHGKYRVRAILDRVFNINMPGPQEHVSFRSLLNEAPEAEIKPRGSAKRRFYRDDPELVGKYFELDPDKIVPRYLRQMYSDSAMIDLFGDIRGTSQRNLLQRSFREREEAIPDGPSRFKEISLLRALHERELQAIDTALDHIRGVSNVDWGNLGKRSIIKTFVNTISSWNVARFLSDTVFSQLQDQANVALRLDGWRAIGRSVVNMTRMIFSPQLRKQFASQVQEFGVGGSLFMENLRHQDLISIQNAPGVGAKAEQVSSIVASKVVEMSGVQYLDAFTQHNAAYMGTGILRDIAHKTMKGQRLQDFEVRFANDFKLTHGELLKIGKQINAHSEVDGNVFNINLGEWRDKALADRCRLLFHRLGVSATMVPGAELPAFFKNPLGKFLLQFKSFATATFGKMFLPSLEQGGQSISNTILQCMLLDYFGKICKDFGKFSVAQKPDVLTGELKEEALQDRLFRLWGDTVTQTDWTGWCMDPTGLLRTWLSPDSDSWPTQSNTYMSFFKDLGGAGSAALSLAQGMKPDKSNVKAVWRMVPFQNYFLMRSGISAIRAGHRKFFPQPVEEEESESARSS